MIWINLQWSQLEPDNLWRIALISAPRMTNNREESTIGDGYFLKNIPVWSCAKGLERPVCSSFFQEVHYSWQLRGWVLSVWSQFVTILAWCETWPGKLHWTIGANSLVGSLTSADGGDRSWNFSRLSVHRHWMCLAHNCLMLRWKFRTLNDLSKNYSNYAKPTHQTFFGVELLPSETQ